LDDSSSNGKYNKEICSENNYLSYFLKFFDEIHGEDDKILFLKKYRSKKAIVRSNDDEILLEM
jgi:hypothetical protein